MLGPVRSLSNVHITLQNGYASAERIFDILDENSMTLNEAVAASNSESKAALLKNKTLNFLKKYIKMIFLTLDISVTKWNS